MDHTRHLVQLRRDDTRAVARVDGDQLVFLKDVPSTYKLAQRAIAEQSTLIDLVDRLASRGDVTAYEPVYQGESMWRLLPAWDHPHEPARCLVTGTGLTHKASADNRQAMHDTDFANLTDSMKMYRLGLAGGKPEAGEVGVSPEWFYKGRGEVLRAHGEPLTVPPYARSGNEEPEVAGCYLIDDAGWPRRVGLATANEFSDHATERQNYLYLASSKLRHCGLGPELRIGGDFNDIAGTVHIERNGQRAWSADIATGEANMCHSLANLEHHHFKHPSHRLPGDAHVYFFGADAFSSGQGVQLEAGDRMVVHWRGFGRPLVNPLRVDAHPTQRFEVRSL